MKKSKRKSVKVKVGKGFYMSGATGGDKGAGTIKPAAVKPVEIVKVALPPDKVLHVEAPRDHIPIVAVHPSKSIVEIAAVPKKKKRTFLQWVFGEYP